MIQRLLLTLFFIDNKTKLNTIIESFLVETAVCEFFIAVLHHYSCFCINDITLFYVFHSTWKGFNYSVWFGFIVDAKQGKQESLNHYRIITNIADQKDLKE